MQTQIDDNLFGLGKEGLAGGAEYVNYAGPFIGTIGEVVSGVISQMGNNYIDGNKLTDGLSKNILGNLAGSVTHNYIESKNDWLKKYPKFLKNFLPHFESNYASAVVSSFFTNLGNTNFKNLFGLSTLLSAIGLARRYLAE